MHKNLRFIAWCLLALAILLWFGWNLDWAGVWTALGRSDWRLIALAVALVSATYLLRAARWRALLRPLAPEADLKELFAATTVGFGAVFLLGRAGEVVRPAFLPLSGGRVGPAASFVTIAVERIYDLAAVVIIFAANLLIFRADGVSAEAYGRVRQAGLTLLLGAFAGLVVLLVFRRHAEAVIRRLEARREGLPRALDRAARIFLHLLGQLARALSVLVDARALLVTVGWTALLWAVITAADLLVLRAFGLPLGVSETIFVMGWALVGSLVPTPGGAAGSFHLATAYGLIFLGVGETESKAAAIVLHLVLFGPALFYGLYYFLRSDVSLARLRVFTSSMPVGHEAGDRPPESRAEENSLPGAGAASGVRV